MDAKPSNLDVGVRLYTEGGPWEVALIGILYQALIGGLINRCPINRMSPLGIPPRPCKTHYLNYFGEPLDVPDP